MWDVRCNACDQSDVTPDICGVRPTCGTLHRKVEGDDWKDLYLCMLKTTNS